MKSAPYISNALFGMLILHNSVELSMLLVTIVVGIHLFYCCYFMNLTDIPSRCCYSTSYKPILYK